MYLAYVPRMGDYPPFSCDVPTNPETRAIYTMCWHCHSWVRRMVGQYLWWGRFVADCGYPHTESDQIWSSCSYLLQIGFHGIILEASIA